ncbi:MAG: hypothetical protein QXV17_15060 [Candidatus Micrarchaeaceae archaeon]
MSKAIQGKNKVLVTVGSTIPENRLRSVKDYYHFISSIIRLPDELSFNDFVLHLLVSRIVTLEEDDVEVNILKSIKNKTAFLSLRMTNDFHKRLLFLGNKVANYLNGNENKGGVTGINKFLKENLALYIASTINEFNGYYKLLTSFIYFHFLEIIDEIFGEMITPDEKAKMLKNLEFPKILQDGKNIFIDFLSLISFREEDLYIERMNTADERSKQIVSRFVSFLNENNKTRLREYTEPKLFSELDHIEIRHTELLTLWSILSATVWAMTSTTETQYPLHNPEFDTELLLSSLSILRSNYYAYKKIEKLPELSSIKQLSFTEVTENYELCEHLSKNFFRYLRGFFNGTNEDEEFSRINTLHSSNALYPRIASLLLSS